MRATASLLIAACLLATSVGSAVAAPSAAGTTAWDDLDVNPDDVLLEIDVREDGDAVWTVEYRVRLEDDERREAFESQRADIEANSSAYADRFEARMASVAADAEEATGREMRVANVSVTAETRQLPREYGVITYRFEWRGFAATEGDELRVGDAIAGLFLDEDTRLVVSWPGGYRPVEVAPTPTEEREGAVVWRGPTDFAGDEPRIVVSDAPGVGAYAPVAAGVAALLVVAGGLAWRRRAGGTWSAVDGASDDRTPSELMSNEERVLALLEEEGGRVKQQEIVRSLGWTDAKTSQVIGDMREEGSVEVFRLGRENVVSLPDDDT